MNFSCFLNGKGITVECWSSGATIPPTNWGWPKSFWPKIRRTITPGSTGSGCWTRSNCSTTSWSSSNGCCSTTSATIRRGISATLSSNKRRGSPMTWWFANCLTPSPVWNWCVTTKALGIICAGTFNPHNSQFLFSIWYSFVSFRLEFYRIIRTDWTVTR